MEVFKKVGLGFSVWAIFLFGPSALGYEEFKFFDNNFVVPTQMEQYIVNPPVMVNQACVSECKKQLDSCVSQNQGSVEQQAACMQDFTVGCLGKCQQAASALATETQRQPAPAPQTSCYDECKRAIPECLSASDAKSMEVCQTGVQQCATKCTESLQLPPAPPMPQPVRMSEIRTGEPGGQNQQCISDCQKEVQACFSQGNDLKILYQCKDKVAQCMQKCGGALGVPMPSLEGQPSRMGMPGGFPGGEEGDKQFEEMMKRQQEQAEKHQAQAMEMMRKQALRAAKMFAGMVKHVENAQAKGVTIPQELLDILVKVKTLPERATAAKTFEELQDLVEEIQDAGQTFAQLMPMLEQAASLPKVLKQVEKEFSRLKKAVDRQRSKLKNVLAELGDKVTELDVAVASIRAALDEATKLAKEDPSEAMERLQDGAFDHFEDAWQLYGSLEAVRSLKSTLRQIQRQIKGNDRVITRLAKQKTDVTELKELQARINEQYQIVAKMNVAKQLDELFDEMSKLGDRQLEFEETLSGLLDDGDPTNDVLDQSNRFGVPQFGPPSGLPGSNIIDEKSLDSMRKIAPFMQRTERGAPVE